MATVTPRTFHAQLRADGGAIELCMAWHGGHHEEITCGARDWPRRRRRGSTWTLAVASAWQVAAARPEAGVLDWTRAVVFSAGLCSFVPFALMPIDGKARVN